MGNEVTFAGLPDTGGSEVYASESRFKSVTRNVRTSMSNTQSRGDLAPVVTPRDLHRLWYVFRDNYSGFGMSKQDDCLVALSGVARYVGSALNDRLIAGIWENNLL